MPKDNSKANESKPNQKRKQPPESSVSHDSGNGTSLPEKKKKKKNKAREESRETASHGDDTVDLLNDSVADVLQDYQALDKRMQRLIQSTRILDSEQA